MNIFLTFDYELFFKNSGTVQKCIIKPTEILLKIFSKYKVKTTFFVDVGYVLKLEEYGKKYKDYKLIIQQIKKLHKLGHEIALHIHPHWEDSYFNGSRWVINTKRYRLHDFSKKEIETIVLNYKQKLEEIIEDEIVSFRAGGWCIQPFSKIKEALKKADIKVDSTLYKGGLNKSKTHYFDFRNMLDKDFYRFEEDPLVEKEDGSFIEIPISSIKVLPNFFWKIAFLKTTRLKKEIFSILGDGSGIKRSWFEKLKYFLLPINLPVSFDEYKVLLVENAYFHYKNRKKSTFVTISHPKLLTNFSFKKLEKFILFCFKNGENFLKLKDIINFLGKRDE